MIVEVGDGTCTHDGQYLAKDCEAVSRKAHESDPPMVTVWVRRQLSMSARDAVADLVLQIERIVDADKRGE